MLSMHLVYKCQVCLVATFGNIWHACFLPNVVEVSTIIISNKIFSTLSLYCQNGIVCIKIKLPGYDLEGLVD